MDDRKMKYSSEFAISFSSGAWTMIPVKNIASEKDVANNGFKEVIDEYYIYLITKLPKIWFDELDCSEDLKKLDIKISYRKKGIVHSNSIKIPFTPTEDTKYIEISEYPHVNIYMLNSNRDKIRYIPINVLPIAIGNENNNDDLRNLEVLYIGKSYSETNNRNIISRLKSHSTLQKILADISCDDPDYEVYVLTMNFDDYNFISQVNGMNENIEIDNRDLNIDRFNSIYESDISKETQVSIVEAAMIKYFQPKYNKIYKDNFPNKSYKILEDVFALDFTGVIVNINSDNLYCRLFSEVVEPSENHSCVFNLSNEDKRQGFFEAFYNTK
ncbi:hypothetical protein AAIR29_00310 [Psychrobacter sp. FBL11]|uniref:Uncharacterized protein n=1 Tax=Psychrobacter saeujeotis TaxID=3143436 RepID=A0ABU9X3U5_9GAMM